MFPNMKGFVRYYKLNITILLFMIMFSIVHILKPGLVYNNDGGYRPFGVGYKHKTVIPIWVVSIILAILSYLVVSVYLQF